MTSIWIHSGHRSQAACSDTVYSHDIIAYSELWSSLCCDNVRSDYTMHSPKAADGIENSPLHSNCVNCVAMCPLTGLRVWIGSNTRLPRGNSTQGPSALCHWTANTVQLKLNNNNNNNTSSVAQWKQSPELSTQANVRGAAPDCGRCPGRVNTHLTVDTGTWSGAAPPIRTVPSLPAAGGLGSGSPPRIKLRGRVHWPHQSSAHKRRWWPALLPDLLPFEVAPDSWICVSRSPL